MADLAGSPHKFIFCIEKSNFGYSVLKLFFSIGVNREGEALKDLVVMSYMVHLETIFRTVTRVSTEKKRVVRSPLVLAVLFASLNSTALFSRSISTRSYPKCPRKLTRCFRRFAAGPRPSDRGHARRLHVHRLQHRHCEGRGRDGEREFPGAHAEDFHRQRALVSAPFVFCACSPGLVVKGCPACVCFPKRAGLLAFGLLLFVLHVQRSNQYFGSCCFPCPV